MKKLLRLAFVLYTIGILSIVDWIVFWNRNSQLVTKDYTVFKQKYIDHFPEILQPLYLLRPEPAIILIILFFVFAGIIFLKQYRTIYIVLSITSFAFAMWNIFSLM